MRPDGRILILYKGSAPMWPDDYYWENDEFCPEYQVPVKSWVRDEGLVHYVGERGTA